MKQKKLGKVFEEFEGRDVHIERVRVLELLLLHLVDDLNDGVFELRFGHVIEGTVVPLGLVLPLHLMYFRPCNILVD